MKLKLFILGLILTILAGCYATSPIARCLEYIPTPATQISIAWPWDSTEIYSAGDKVWCYPQVEDQQIYISIKDGNQGKNPAMHDGWWNEAQ